MNPVDELTSSIEHGTWADCRAFAADATVSATVPGRRFSLRGVESVREQFAEWFATPGRFEELRRTSLPTGELVEFLRMWDEPTGQIAAHQVHVLEVEDGRITADRMWCGGRW